eukprot:568135-Prorocentrum_lima.AAC.1
MCIRDSFSWAISLPQILSTWATSGRLFSCTLCGSAHSNSGDTAQAHLRLRFGTPAGSLPVPPTSSLFS